ncbi:ABC transporter ATP-binding protein [Ferdinandcohnia quinoae]|uniref:ATP-binding cassette domain-containing protein n=1 Tax=Fredinandcohnia quinoae TaxID=2918902 RepID=A0AAW5E3Y7_9BACI|nr:ATP-binding cassette domain-containing protein [Fredinandcohnia sp. SECRCQ15]MCH1627073.1 ATP-binding cassette domain-containing protein [Fredinandcohnia sp. SECRCQ15]
MDSNIYVKNVRLKFPGEKSLLFKDLSCSFEKGEKVLILGPSGCGKSTLLQVLSGLIPHSVEVPMKAEGIKVPQSWGYVFQDPDTQFCMPYVDEEIAFVLENLQIPREQMNGRIKQHLEQVGLQLEDIHMNIQTLSGGMKQRLAIASVLALEPEVLFLDEPTAMLDPKGTKEIWEIFKKVGSDKTIIVVEHKIDHVLEFIDRIILFNEIGQIIADGRKEDILSQYKENFKSQGIWYPGVWEEYTEGVHKGNLQIIQDTEPLLQLSNFTGYRKKQKKIYVENIRIYPGEWIVIKGENGAGKSTLLHSLMQFIKTSGVYKLNGKIIKNGKKISDLMTFVFQNPEFQFVTNSVFEEIAFSLRLGNKREQEIQMKVQYFLHMFHLLNHQDKHPFQLSMGQKRRLSVAASIVRGQRLLLLDEPTFGQDSKNTFALLELLEEFRQNLSTILMVTHDENIEKYFATRVWTISNGEILSDQKVTMDYKKSESISI